RTVRSNAQALHDHPTGQPSTLRELWQLDRPRTIDGTSLFMHEHPTARALRGERVRGETLAVKRGPDGRQVIIEVNSNPLYDEHALNPIRAASCLLQANANDAEKVRDDAERSAKAAETGAATAARVGRFIRQEPLQGESEELVALSQVCDEVVAMARPLWAERAKGGVVKFERDLASGVMVRGIAGELREALLNLVQNALDAMAGGGTLA